MKREEMLRRLEAGENPLELSIEKWQDIVDKKGTEDSYLNCALCEIYNKGLYLCPGCPVATKTGSQFCVGTPYADYEKAQIHHKTRKQIAIQELEFLKSLRKSP